MACLAVGYVATCAGVLIFKERSDAPEARAREARIAIGDFDQYGAGGPGIPCNHHGWQDIRFRFKARWAGPGQLFRNLVWSVPERACTPGAGDLAEIPGSRLDRDRDRGR